MARYLKFGVSEELTSCKPSRMDGSSWPLHISLENTCGYRKFLPSESRNLWVEQLLLIGQNKEMALDLADSPYRVEDKFASETLQAIWQGCLSWRDDGTIEILTDALVGNIWSQYT